jgi:hypothetical protein
VTDLKPITKAEIVAEVARQEQPVGVAQSVAPSGIEIYYQAAPKRLYRVRKLPVKGWTGDCAEWFEVPSVSSITDVLEKGGLSWWGMKVGVEGAISLLLDNHLSLEAYPTIGTDGVVDMLKEHKLTVNHVKGAAADRGTNVHAALEAYADSGTLPNPDFFPETERGYVAGLLDFLIDAKPKVLHSELMVGSVEYGLAGRFDMVAEVDANVITKTYPKRLPIVERITGRILFDLKTSKGVYPSYHIQTAGYVGAYAECGYGEVDDMAVVRVTDDGRYEVVRGRADYDDFLKVLDVYRVVKGLS